MCEILAALFLVLTGPDHQTIVINPNEIVVLREPRVADHFAKGTHCLVFTADGKYVAVVETCQKVHDMLEEK